MNKSTLRNASITLRRIILAFTLLAALAAANPLHALNYHYFSGGGANGNWSNPANWLANGVPPANNTNIGVLIMTGANNKTSIVDIAGLTLAELHFLQVSNHTISSPVARTIRLTGQGASNPVVRMTIPSNQSHGRFVFDSNIELVVSNTCLFHRDYANYFSSGSFTPNDILIIAGRISGPGSVRFSAESTFAFGMEVTLSGAQANTYVGSTTVDSNIELFLNKTTGSAIPGALTVLTEWAGVTCLRSQQISDTAPVVVQGGSISLNGNNETLGLITLAMGGIYSGSGLLTLNGDVMAIPGPGQYAGGLFANVALGTPTDARIGRQIIVNANEMTISGSISGSPILRKTGLGDLFLNGSNTYSGLTVIAEGELWISRSNALGSATSGTWIGPTSTLGVYENLTSAEPLDVTDHQTQGSFYAMEVESATVQWTGPIQLQGHARFVVTSPDSGGHLDIRSPITGPGTFVIYTAQDSDVTFSGTATNTHTGGTESWGNLILRRAGSGRAIPGTLEIAGSVKAELPDQFAPTSAVTILQGGQLWQEAHQYIGSLSGGGFVVLDASILTAGLDNSDTTYGGSISSFGSPNSFIKAGSGTLTLTGRNTHTGNTTIQGGRLTVHGTNTVSPINILTAASLSGTGIVAQVTGTGGSTSPGPGWGALRTGSLAWTVAHTYRPEINGTNSSVDGDVLRVTGSVNLNGAALSPVISTPGRPGATYLLIDNDGTDAVTNTFAGKAQGALLTLNGIQYQISYTGGTGNDVVLTQLSIPPAPTLSGIQHQPGGAMQINGSGGRGFQYEIHATLSLVPPAWVNLGTVTGDPLIGALQFIDADAGQLPARFYRFVIP